MASTRFGVKFFHRNEFYIRVKPVGMFRSPLTLNVFYLLDGLQHGPASVPGLGGLLDAV